jgi:hypothetical protein
MKTLHATLALALLAGCATGEGAKSGGTAVSDADFGRLGPGRTGAVNQARQFLASAQDEEARAKLRLQEGQHEGELSKVDEDTAKAAVERSQAHAKMANESRDPAELERSRTLKQQADAAQRAAKAHEDYAKKAVAARQAAVDAAHKQVELGNARVELAKLQALQQGQVPAAGKYDMAKFQQRVDKAQKDFDAALQKTRDQELQATAAQRAYEDAQQQAQAQTVPLGTPQTGTGVGGQ